MTNALKQISPLRNSTTAKTAKQLTEEQLRHFGIDPASEYGVTLSRLTRSLYTLNAVTVDLARLTMETLQELDRSDRIAYFNAKRFASFQLAKILDTLQNPMRASYQSLVTQHDGFACKGPFPLFDNVTALFSATPVIARTATYLFACAEWVEDAFTGREMLHQIYSRLLNPTSISLANHMVDLECGPVATEYLAWNFNSGMAAIDGLLSHLLGYSDIVLASRNVYGGTHQLLQDWFGKRANLNVAVDWFDGFDGSSFELALENAEAEYADRIAEGRKIYVFLESPCNPHGNVLDVSDISRIAHAHGWLVVCDSTVGTPFLHPTLKDVDVVERPDFVIHSYTKDLAGTGTTTAGVVIGRIERMFMPKGESLEIKGPAGEVERISWDETLFWNVYYVKGAFLDADKAFEVLNGIRTYESRVLQKAINTLTLARILVGHPDINVNCPAVPEHPNGPIMKKVMRMELPAPLFTIDMEGIDDQPSRVSRSAFKRFYDSLEPIMGLQVSLGQNNTLALCPAITSHSELSEQALKYAGITPTTTRISVGLEDPRTLIAHMKRVAAFAIEPDCPGFCDAFPSSDQIDKIYRETYLDVHRRFIGNTPSFDTLSA